jgi:cytochrome c oxidase assembly protein subunit 15
MEHSPSLRRTSAYKPGLAVFACLGSAWVFVLVTLGAFTTTIGAGMAFPDWPLSNGSLNPQGWLDNLAMFAEHSHRLSAGVMSTITIILAIWLWRSEERAWLRKLALFAVALVLVQALVGGLRVLCDQMQVELVDTSLGRLFAMLHACLAQLFACTLIAIAAACTRGWIMGRVSVSDGVRRAGLLCCTLLFVQLGIAAVVRHSFAGLAILTFPYSTFNGGLIPVAWNFRIAIHFAHRVMALIIVVVVVLFAFRIWADRKAAFGMRLGALLLVGLVALQIFLGAQIIWTLRSAAMTTGHVLVGAFTLATAFCLTWLAHRDVIEKNSPSLVAEPVVARTAR